MKRRAFALAAVALLAPTSGHAAPSARATGEPPALAPWEHWSVERDSAPVDVWVAHDDVRRRLFVMLQGSHCVPLFWRTEDGTRVRSSLLFESVVERNDHAVHFAALERKNLHSFGPASAVADRCTREHGSVSKEERVADVVDVVRALVKEPWVAEVFLVGHSEGADVAAGAARVLGDAVAGVGFLSSGGPSQFYDEVAAARRDGDAAGAQQRFDELLALTGDHPPADYEGFPAERFLSYAVRSTPLDDLRAVDTPVFIAQGTRDRNAAVEGADVLAVELLRASPKRHVRYLVGDGLDHGYATADGTDHREDVYRAFAAWALDPAHPRGVETRHFVADASTPRVRYLRIDVRTWRAIGVVALVLAAVALMVKARRSWQTSTRA